MPRRKLPRRIYVDPQVRAAIAESDARLAADKALFLDMEQIASRASAAPPEWRDALGRMLARLLRWFETHDVGPNTHLLLSQAILALADIDRGVTPETLKPVLKAGNVSTYQAQFRRAAIVAAVDYRVTQGDSIREACRVVAMLMGVRFETVLTLYSKTKYSKKTQLASGVTVDSAAAFDNAIKLLKKLTEK